MAADKIGPAKCPLCGGTASLSLAKTQLPVLTCNACNIQLFTRSDKSDQLVRELLHKKQAPEPTPEPKKAPTVTPPPVRPEPTPETPEPVRTGFKFGF